MTAPMVAGLGFTAFVSLPALVRLWRQMARWDRDGIGVPIELP